MKIAIVTVAYNRVNSLSRLLSSLEKAYYNGDDITLIISVDKSNTDVVERFADDYQWDYGHKIVDKHKENLGLRQHMMSLGKWFDKFDALVVLEDDIVVSPNYYTYTCQTVKKYHECKEVAGVSLYGFSVNYLKGLPFQPIKDENDVYFMNCAMSWGEIWMKESWRIFYDWYQQHQDFPIIQELPRAICLWKNKSWLKYHTRYCIEEDKYFVHPYVSLSSNFGDEGEHSKGGGDAVFQVAMQQGNKKEFLLPEFGDNAIIYDGFFENKILYQTLGLGADELCLDLNGEWNNRLNKRYWLTTKIQNFKIIKSFGLDYRPIELNVINNIQGNHIFLYDTSVRARYSHADNRKGILYYYYLSNITFIIKEYGLGNCWRDFINKSKQKLCRINIFKH